MKRFVFQFQKLLDYRSHLEREEQIRFTGVLHQYLTIEERINTTKTRKQSIFQQSHEMLEGGHFDILALKDLSLIGLNKRMKQDNIRLKEKSYEVEKAKEVYLETSKNRKIIEKLRFKAEERYYTELEKEEQKDLDEVGINLFNKKRREEEMESISIRKQNF